MMSCSCWLTEYVRLGGDCSVQQVWLIPLAVVSSQVCYEQVDCQPPEATTDRWRAVEAEAAAAAAAAAAASAESVRYLSTTEALKPTMLKLLLASCTGAGVWLMLGAAWQLLRLGWGLLCFAWQLLCMAWWLSAMAGSTNWWLLCWPWINLVWRPTLMHQVGQDGSGLRI